MKTKKKITIFTICFFPFRLFFWILLSICIICSYIKNAIKKWIYRNRIDLMTGIEFEHFTKELLEHNGFHHVEITQASNDYGIDVLAMKKQTLYAIQCKKYKNKVGIEAVREAATGCTYYDQDVAVVFTNSTFSPQAIKLAETLEVELWDGETLQKLMKHTKRIKKRKRLLLFIFLSILIILFFYIK